MQFLPPQPIAFQCRENSRYVVDRNNMTHFLLLSSIRVFPHTIGSPEFQDKEQKSE